MFNTKKQLLKSSSTLVRFQSKKIHPDTDYTPKFRPPKLRFDFDLPEHKGPSYEENQRLRHEHLSPSLATFQAYQKPFYLTRAKYQYLWDHKGRRYLDLLAQNLTVSVGHNHPRVVDAAKKQMEKLVHSTTMYYNNEPAEYAKELKEKLPKNNDWVIHLVNSGSEAIDLAMLMSRAYTGSWDILTLRNSYHGLQGGAMGATGISTCKQDGIPDGLGIKHVMNPDGYRGFFKHGDKDMAKNYAKEIKNVIDYSTPGKVAGFIFEQVQGFGGIHPLPDGYLKEAFKYVREAGGLCIADEVQTGFGRMGTDYWSFEMQNVDPDIIVMAKGMGNGFPMAAVACRRDIAESMSKKSFFNTYGGNPTMSAIGREVLKVIDDEKIMENAKTVGKEYKDMLNRLKDKYPIIGDVRGHGLMMGVDIVKDKESKEPAKQEAIDAFELIRDNGVIMGKGGMYGNVLRVMPPMCVNSDDVKFTEQVMDYAFDQVCNKI